MKQGCDIYYQDAAKLTNLTVHAVKLRSWPSCTSSNASFYVHVPYRLMLCIINHSLLLLLQAAPMRSSDEITWRGRERGSVRSSSMNGRWERAQTDAGTHSCFSPSAVVCVAPAAVIMMREEVRGGGRGGGGRGGGRMVVWGRQGGAEQERERERERGRKEAAQQTTKKQREEEEEERECIHRTWVPAAEEEEEGGFQTGWAQQCLDGVWARF